MVVGHLNRREFFPGELAAELAPGENTWLPVLGSRGSHPEIQGGKVHDNLIT